MKCFVLAGWSKKEHRVMYWYECYDSYYSGFKTDYSEASILTNENLKYILEDHIDFWPDCMYYEIIDLKKIEVKLGEYVNV